MIYLLVSLLLIGFGLSRFVRFWSTQEAAKGRPQFDRIMQASESKPWQPPPRGPKGGDWRNKRKAA